MKVFLDILVAFVIIGLTTYQFMRGAVFTRSWGWGASRSENPIEFWVTIWIQILVAVGLVILSVVGIVQG